MRTLNKIKYNKIQYTLLNVVNTLNENAIFNPRYVNKHVEVKGLVKTKLMKRGKVLHAHERRYAKP